MKYVRVYWQQRMLCCCKNVFVLKFQVEKGPEFKPKNAMPHVDVDVNQTLSRIRCRFLVLMYIVEANTTLLGLNDELSME